MLFNSVDFAFFLPIVFFLYWFVFNRKIKTQNVLILIVSYLFYGWWDYRFLFLIFASSLVDYIIGIAMEKTNVQKKRKILLSVSLLFNLGCLGFFKYFNFFYSNFLEGFTYFGKHFDPITLQIILPVGISFYTLQTLSYSIDVYRGELKPTRDFWAFFSYVSFFPQLVAGPIERASNLLPQFFRQREFNYANGVDGLRLILWGLVKKMVIADNCAVVANQIFSEANDYTGLTLFIGAVMFAFQIYGDFSGYSDIAIGAAKLFGFGLMTNFSTPYFSQSIPEFWRRWHISLSSWFRDYLYIPLGGSRQGKIKTLRNIFIIFLVSGFWHGANWTFIVWGILHSLFFVLFTYIFREFDLNGKKYLYKAIVKLFRVVFTFTLVVIAWVFFRAENIDSAVDYLGRLSIDLFNFQSIVFAYYFMQYKVGYTLVTFIIVFFIIEWYGRNDVCTLKPVSGKLPLTGRYFMYYLLIFVVLYFSGESQSFIYFQF